VNPDLAVTLAILGAAGILFVSGRIRVDAVAILVVLALMLSGVRTPAEALSGFGNTVVLLVAALLVVGESISRTGVAAAVGLWIARRSRGSETRTRLLLVLAPAVLGSVMSSTAVVAIFIPVVMTVAREHRIAPSRLLLPLSYGALISGMMTLIGTAPNVIASAELRERGFEGLGFFSFTPVGAGVLGAALLLFGLATRWVLPAAAAPQAGRAPGMREIWAAHAENAELHRLRVVTRSTLLGSTPKLAQLGGAYGVRVVMLERLARGGWGRGAAVIPTPDTEFRAGDTLTLIGPGDGVARLAADHRLRRMRTTERDVGRLAKEVGVATVLVHPESSLIGRSLEQASFRTRYNLHVAGVRRGREALHDFQEAPLQAADTLLVVGPWSRIARLPSDAHELIVLTLPAEMAAVAPARGKAPYALAILAGMVFLSAFDIVPVVVAALLAAAAAVATRCVPMAEVYRTMHWGSLVLIAGLLPLADALDQTGAVSHVVDAAAEGLGALGPRAMLAAFFLATALVGSLLSNTATAVLMAPIAVETAVRLGVEPHAFAMTVAIAASSAFLTPVSSPVVTLVVEPGGYRFSDFLRAGVPTLLLSLLVCLVVIPLLFPLG
jgi:di/tricarboxylate transporter